MQVHASFRRDAKKGATLYILFYSTDLVSLRASFNTNLRLVASALKTLQTVASLKRKRRFHRQSQTDYCLRLSIETLNKQKAQNLHIRT